MEFKKLYFFDHSIDVISNETTMLDYVKRITASYESQQKDDPFCVMDVGQVFRKHKQWREQLPSVKPYYAIKCNNNGLLLSVLSGLGCGFDCASLEEIKQIMSLGVGANRLIFANACKSPSSLREASARGVKMMTLDSESELDKIHTLYPNAKLILRIATADSGASFNLSEKFGCEPTAEAPKILKKAAEINMEIIGMSFHVGSGCRDPDAYEKAIQLCHRLFEIGQSYNHDMCVLDIGGGYPGHLDSDQKFAKIASVIRDALTTYFPHSSGVQIIGEPGRYYATSPYTLCVNVIGKKIQQLTMSDLQSADSESNGARFIYEYFINDGIYNFFNSILFEGIGWVSTPKLLNGKSFHQQRLSKLWGPTGCNMDCVLKEINLPELNIGDWLVFENMGAYTTTVSSEFNGFKRPKIHYAIQEKDSILLQNIVQDDMF